MKFARYLIGACISLWLVPAPVHALNTLFTDTFAGSSANPTAWTYGSGSISASLSAGDTYWVNTTSGMLVVTDAAPYSASAPVAVHTTPGSNFRATAEKVLQLNAELTITNSAVSYTVGLFDSTLSGYSTGANSIALTVTPGSAVNNVTLFATSNTGAVLSTVTTTTTQSNLTGSHHYAIQVDYITSTVTPVVRAYSNGILLATLTFTANDGIHPQTSGVTQGTSVRVFVRGASTGGSGAAFALDRATLTAYTPGTNLLDQITGSRAVNRNVFGQNILGGEAKYYYGMYAMGFWDPVAMTYSATLVNKVKTDLGQITSLRYPGGAMGNRFDFRKTIGPVSGRVDATDTSTTGGTIIKGKWSFGLDEFMSLCRAFGAEPMYTAPDILLPAAEMPAHLASLVEYLNAPASPANPWALQRLANTGGYADGYGVKYFEMGNETYYQIAIMDAAAYAAYVHAGGWAMRAVDPAVQIAANTMKTGNELNNEWDMPILESVGRVVDFLVLHIYAPVSVGKDTVYPDPMKIEKAAMAMGHYIDYELKATHRTVESLTGKRLPLAITEFNAQTQAEGAPNYKLSYVLGMQMTDLQRVFLKPENGVLAAHYWQMFTSSYGPLSYFQYSTVTASTVFKEYPAYLPFKIWGQHFMGTTQLTTTVSSPASSYMGYRGTLPASGETYVPEAYLGTTTLTSEMASNVAQINATLNTGVGAGSAVATMSGDTLRIEFIGYDSKRGALTGVWPTLANLPYPSPGRYDHFISYEASYTAGTATLSRPLWITSGADDDRTSNLTMDPVVNPSFRPFYGWFTAGESTLQAAVVLNVLSGSTATTSSTFSGVFQVKNMVMDLYRQESLPAYPILSTAASVSADGKTYYLIVTNKSHYAVPTTVSFSGFTGTSAKYWQVNAPTIWKPELNSGIQTASNATLVLNSGVSATYTFPPHTVTAIEVYK